MTALPLQADPGVAMGPVVTAISLAIVLLGLGISVEAFRGYRRNRSRPMLFLALGIASMTVLRTVATAITGRIVALDYVGVVGQSFTLAGLLCIAFSLYLLKRG